MKSNPTLTQSSRLLLDGAEYDRYTIDSIQWKLTSNILHVKVDYANLTQSKYTARTYPIEAGVEVNVNEVIETIHQLHKKYKV